MSVVAPSDGGGVMESEVVNTGASVPVGEVPLPEDVVAAASESLGPPEPLVRVVESLELVAGWVAVRVEGAETSLTASGLAVGVLVPVDAVESITVVVSTVVGEETVVSTVVGGVSTSVVSVCSTTVLSVVVVVKVVVVVDGSTAVVVLDVADGGGLEISDAVAGEEVEVVAGDEPEVEVEAVPPDSVPGASVPPGSEGAFSVEVEAVDVEASAARARCGACAAPAVLSLTGLDGLAVSGEAAACVETVSVLAAVGACAVLGIAGTGPWSCTTGAWAIAFASPCTAADPDVLPDRWRLGAAGCTE